MKLKLLFLLIIAIVVASFFLQEEKVLIPTPFPAEVLPTVSEPRVWEWKEAFSIIITTNRRLPENVAKEMAKTYVLASKLYGIDMFTLLAKDWVESKYKPTATSYRNGAPLARGVAQFTLPTGKAVWAELGYEWHGVESLYNPIESIMAGAHYLAYLRDKYDGDMMLALTAYNLGPTRLNGYLRNGTVLAFSYASLVQEQIRRDGSEF